MKITKELLGKAAGREIYKYTIINKSGASVELGSIGAGVLAINVPDRDGKLADVVLGYPDAESYFEMALAQGNAPAAMPTASPLGSFLWMA